MQKYSDSELVALYLEAKDLKYLTELFTRHSDIVYRTALRTMKNPSDAEDIMQAAYIKMISNMHLYKGTGSVLGWMLQMVVYSCYDQLRSEKSRLNRERKIMSERTTMTTPKNDELKEMMDNHLSKLPEIYRAPITLQILEGLTIKEVSEVLQIPEKTIRSQIARGLEKLKVSLQNVGVTASVISLSDMLKEIQQPLAPEIYKTSQYFNSLYQQKALASAKLAVTASAKGFVVQKLLTIGLLIVASVSGVFVWNHLVNKSKVIASPQQIQKWDFENSKNLPEYLGIGLVNGGISIVESMGVNNSNALKTEEGTLIEIDISKYKLPIKISFDSDMYVVSDGKPYGHILAKSNYLKEDKTLLISGIVKKINVQASNKNSNAKRGYSGEWLKMEAFIDDTSIDFWINGKRGNILHGVSSDNKKIYLSANKAIIDNLVVESIEKSILPDKVVYQKIFDSFVFKKDVVDYTLQKELLGFDKMSDISPSLLVIKPEYFAIELGVNNDVTYPHLGVSNLVEWVNSRQKLVKKWEFESFKELYDFKLIRGMFGYGEGNGVNNSNSVSVDTQTVLEIDISKYKMPLKITFSFDCVVAKGETSNGFVIAKSKYQENKNILFFTQLSPPPVLDSLNEKIINNNSKLGYYGIWMPAVVYVSEDAIDQWLYDKRAGLTLGSSKDNQKLYINFQDKTFFDNFTIESIEPSAVPDISIFKNFSATLPYNTVKNYYKLEKEKQILNIDESCAAQLGICNSVILEKSLGIDKKLEVIPFGGNNKKP